MGNETFVDLATGRSAVFLSWFCVPVCPSVLGRQMSVLLFVSCLPC
uniref:Uncharacterized protein n=1 Tax=Anguilla anguilla TaxID=7936 RepID=A0A0E9SQ18_ANGAN